MRDRSLIVNADDCNLTPGVTRAILECHATGIVTSTTFLINLPVDFQDISILKRQKKLGVGLHLNVTLGRPVSVLSRIKTLVKEDGSFLSMATGSRARPGNRKELPRPQMPHHVYEEFENQIIKFKKIFSRLPTHLDTHHHLHQSKQFLSVLKKVAQKYRLPFRSSVIGFEKGSQNVPLFGDLDPKKYWTRKKVEACIQSLPLGVSEMMCHPGSNDAALKRISRFQKGRTTEWRILRCRGLRRFVKEQKVNLIHYGMIQ